ncbi:general odorant-binding protein 28a-like [Musca vetustissima]|uniref:general odorant-binding protein 28a-like n=1 Tax=Musca vetustissima TaxID=27455 RepID=UPI002AB7BE00|nr:general odorant-binding protein 28a-like [Musca vetustissima]
MAKYFLTFAILCVVGAVLVRGAIDKNALIAEFMSKGEACKAETGATDADLAEIIGKKSASTAEGKCLRACIMKKYEVIDANGKFAPSVALKHAEMYTEGADDKMKIAREIIDACAKISVSDDHCEAAEEYCKCLHEQALAHGVEDIDI